MLIYLKEFYECLRGINKSRRKDYKIALAQPWVLANALLYQKLALIFLISKLSIRDWKLICK